MLYLGVDNKLYHPNDEISIGSFRAYFKTDISAVLVGDLNDDGEVNVSDVTMLVSMILGNTPRTSAADVNGDSEVNVSDVTALVSIILGDNSPSIHKINKVVTNVGIDY